MIRHLILKQLDAQEQALGESIEYIRHILRTSLNSFVKFALFMPLSQHRQKLPAAPYHVARILAIRDEDCGTCVQIEVNLALQNGLSAEVLHAVLENRPEDLPDNLADVYWFTKAVIGASGQEDKYREGIRALYGETGLVELALAISSSRVFPITKRSLDYATSCASIEIQV
jgi:alkylhydroperoxidase family enzyme